jgi:5-methylcytosine-specific restriction endonuclease McrBC regulatory subunit McrC
VHSPQKLTSDFKALPLNKKIFDKQDSLPEVGKKSATSFDEFKLSRPNSKLGKRSLEDYLTEQERLKKAEFKARSLDKKVLRTPPRLLSRQATELKTECAPFNF